MVNVMKQGIDYYPQNVNFFFDEKIVTIEERFGMLGGYIAIRLLHSIYAQGYYISWNAATCAAFCRALPYQDGHKPITAALVKQVLTHLISVGFFDEGMYRKYKILTSHGIQRRYFEITKRRRGIKLEPKYLLTDTADSQSVEKTGANCTQIADNLNATCMQNERKLSRKRKENQSKGNPSPSISPSPLQGDGEEEGGGTDISQEEEGGQQMRILLARAGVDKDTIWELQRLTDNFAKGGFATDLVADWLKNRQCKDFELRQHLKGLEDKGQIKPAMRYKDWQVMVWLRENLPPADSALIWLSARSSVSRLESCRTAIAEIKKGKINQPAAFIRSRINSR